MFKKYKWNFLFVVLIVSIIGFIIFDLIFYHSIKNYLYTKTIDEMRMKTHLAVMWLRQKNLQSLPENINALNDITFQIRNIVNARVTIIDSTGCVLTDSDVPGEKLRSMDNHLNRPEVQQALVKGWGQSYRQSETVKRKLFYTTFQIKHPGKSIGFLRLAYYAQHFEESLNKVKIYIIVANLIGLVILFFTALFLGNVVTFPILKLALIAQKISEGNLERNFPVGRKDEIGTLAAILNQLTERLQTQIRQISSERSKLQNILTNLDIGIILVDQHNNILQANPEIFRILEIEAAKANQNKVIEILHSESLRTAILKTLDDKNKETGEFTCLRDGRKIFLSYVVTPFLIPEKESTGALIQLHNITELKTLEAIRRDFVANASHELKTPLTAIMGYAETLIDGAADFPTSRMKFIRRIREQAQRLEFLVADLLKLSEIERERPLTLVTIPLVPMLGEIIEDFNEQSTLKNIKISFISSEHVRVKINEEGIRTVFNNLIDNALKYSHEDSTITIRVIDLKTNRVRIEVIDNGIGINCKYHERIFQRFYRVDKARSRALGGTGLGLAIVKHIIEQHGSKIHVQSEEGNGSCFWFELQKG